MFKIARLNHDQGLGIGLNALVSLAPTDQYGRETVTGPAAVPLFILYGAKDDDVSGWTPYAGYNVRQSGFSLYDRYDDKDKSMAFVYEATHNGFVNYNDIPVALSVTDQQKILLAYTNAFFRMHLRSEPEWLGMFTGEWKPPAVGATPAQIYFQYRSTQNAYSTTLKAPILLLVGRQARSEIPSAIQACLPIRSRHSYIPRTANRPTIQAVYA